MKLNIIIDKAAALEGILSHSLPPCLVGRHGVQPGQLLQTHGESVGREEDAEVVVSVVVGSFTSLVDFR